MSRDGIELTSEQIKAIAKLCDERGFAKALLRSSTGDCGCFRLIDHVNAQSWRIDFEGRVSGAMTPRSNTTKGGQDVQAFYAWTGRVRPDDGCARRRSDRTVKLELVGRLARVVVHALASPTPPPIYRPAAMTYWTSPEEQDQTTTRRADARP